MAEIPFLEKAARAAELERLLASGARIPPDTIAGLLASGDEELELLGSYLVPEHRPRRVDRDVATAAERAAAAPRPTVATMTIIVHGAFAAGNAWWKPNGGFNDYLARQTGDLYREADYFRWSGGGFHDDRTEAAAALVRWAEAHPAEELDVVSHSHGGNVCFLATRLGLKIRKLVSLATPICLDYLPDLRQIGILHNVISLADIIQGPASFIGVSRRGDGRTLADSRRTINHLATEDGQGQDGQGRAPSHSELHDPATWRASGLEEKLIGPGSLPATRT
jgi:pimeloyl-ACP methyl ester carboxylesterase